MTIFDTGAPGALFFENFIPFKSLHNQIRVKEYLNNIISSKKIPHAFLFSGTDGVGKETAAIEFAKLLNFTFADKNIFLRIEKFINNFNEPYVKYIFPLPRGKGETSDNTAYEKLTNVEIENIRTELKRKSENPYYNFNIPKANTIKVNSIREINKFLSLQYEENTYRIILISHAENMNEEAQNALLKNLEEPPDGTIFILVTSKPDNLFQTIISRCWLVEFDPLDVESLVKILVNNFGIGKNEAVEVAPFAEGSVTAAMNLLSNDFEKMLDTTIQLLRNCLGKRYQSAFKILTPYLTESEKKSFQLILKLIVIWLNDVQKNKYEINDYYFSKYEETFKKFNQKFTKSDISQLVTKIENINGFVNKNCNMNVLASNLIFEIASLGY